MSKGIPHTDQHWIPQSYLKGWADPGVAEPGPRVWRLSKDGQRSSKKSPKGIFFEEDLYTIQLADGTRDLRVEHGLSGLESEFVQLRDGVIAQNQALDPRQDLLLRAFIAAMHSRTRAHLEHWQSQFKGLQEMMDRMRAAYTAKTPEERDRMAKSILPTVPSGGPTYSYEDVQQVAEGPVGPMVVAMVQSQLPTLARMNLAVLSTDDPVGFITSDRPCVWFDPEAYKRPPIYRGVGLALPKGEVTLPASPTQLLLLSWQELKGYYKIPVDVLDDLNRRTRFYCDEYFICRRNETRAIWFDPGKPPDEEEGAV